MGTRKLYYEDCLCREFSARVTGCEKAGGGWQVTLDATAFYPEGGGQACDMGVLGTVRVLDVQEQGQTVAHLCDGPLEPGTTVTGRIDWERRFDLMQQHAGEHIVSGIIHKMFGYQNTGFHVGADVLTVDFDGWISPEAFRQIEQQANRAIWEDLPVRCWYPTEEELPGVTYRTKRALPWPVRIVEIPGYDTCACCGIHVATTGQIGAIKLLGGVRFHQGTRLEMVCGGRALRLFDRVWEQNRLVSQAFSAKILETGAAAQKMNETLAEEKFRATGLENRVFSLIAAGFAGQGDVVYFEDGLAPGAVRELAERIAQSCGGTAGVFSGSDGAGYALCLVNKNRDIRQLGQRMAADLGGKGGGKPGFFQGSVKATREQIEEFFKNKW